jgi:ribonuclease I
MQFLSDLFGSSNNEKCYVLSLLHSKKGLWHIHGLWVDYKNGGYPTHCKQVQFDQTKLKTIMGPLNVFWYSDSEKNSLFWEHEYKKHGSCTTLEEFDYFNKTLDLYKEAIKLNLQDKYNKNGIALIPVTNNYKLVDNEKYDHIYDSDSE